MGEERLQEPPQVGERHAAVPIQIAQVKPELPSFGGVATAEGPDPPFEGFQPHEVIDLPGPRTPTHLEGREEPVMEGGSIPRGILPSQRLGQRKGERIGPEHPLRPLVALERGVQLGFLRASEMGVIAHGGAVPLGVNPCEGFGFQHAHKLAAVVGEAAEPPPGAPVAGSPSGESLEGWGEKQTTGGHREREKDARAIASPGGASLPPRW